MKPARGAVQVSTLVDLLVTSAMASRRAQCTLQRGGLIGLAADDVLTRGCPAKGQKSLQVQRAGERRLEYLLASSNWTVQDLIGRATVNEATGSGSEAEAAILQHLGTVVHVPRSMLQ
jgi:hypothetical protein